LSIRQDTAVLCSFLHYFTHDTAVGCCCSE